MGKILKILLLPAILLFIVAGKALDFIGTSTWREDVSSAVNMAIDLVDALWAWLSTPPLWATIVALVLIVVTNAMFLLGDKKMIRFSRVVFRRDARLTEYRELARELIRRSLVAKTILSNGLWDDISHVPPPTGTEAEYKEPGYSDHYFTNLKFQVTDVPSRIDNIFAFARHTGNEVHEIIKIRDDAIGAVRNAMAEAEQNTYDWSRFEGGALFPHERARSMWHINRAAVETWNQIKPEIRRKLEFHVNAELFNPGVEILRQLLAGTGQGTRQ